jgi:hypothetical protein
MTDICDSCVHVMIRTEDERYDINGDYCGTAKQVYCGKIHSWVTPYMVAECKYQQME